MIRPGVTTADVVSLWPKAEEFGFPDEEAAFALQYGHGVGPLDLGKADLQPAGVARAPRGDRGRHGLRARDVLAGVGWLVAPRASRSSSSSRRTGCEVITRFPAEELLVAGAHYYTATGPLTTTRDTQSHLNTAAGRSKPTPVAHNGAKAKK